MSLATLSMSSPSASHLSHPVSMPEEAETHGYPSFEATPPRGHKSLSCLPVLYGSHLVLLSYESQGKSWVGKGPLSF